MVVFGLKSLKNNIKLNEEQVETVNQVVYLGSMILADGCEKENNEISVSNKYYIIHAFIFCVLLYLSEKWLYITERRDKKT